MAIQLIHQIEDALDQALIALASDPARIERAHMQFEKIRHQFRDELDETVFNSWLIHDYKDDRGSVYHQIDVKDDIAQAITLAHLGFYRLKFDKQFIIFENILTKRQFNVQNDTVEVALDEKALYFTRLYDLHGESYMAEDYKQFDLDHGPMIIKNLMAKYNELSNEDSYTIENFLSQNPMILHWASGIVNSIVEETQQDYYCYEVHCVISDPASFSTFKSSEAIRPTDFEDVFAWVVKGEKVAEMVLEDKKVYLECATEEDFEWVKNHIEDQDTGLSVYDTQITSMDALLSDEADV